MSTFLLPGIPFTILTVFFIVRLWRKGLFGKKSGIVETGLAAFWKISAGFSVFVYIGVVAFIVLMWSTLGWWALVIGIETYLILALMGFIFTGKL